MSTIVFDADNHYYETRDCFTRYIEPKHRAKAVHVDSRRERPGPGDGRRQALHLPRKPLLPEGGQAGQACASCCTTWTLDASRGGSDAVEADSARVRRIAMSGWRLMDKQGVDACFMFPDARGVSGAGHERRPRAVVRKRALVQPLGRTRSGTSTAGTESTRRRSCRFATSTAQWVNSSGCLAQGRPRRSPCDRDPAYGRSPADPYFDAFWAQGQRGGCTPWLYHIAESGYNEMMSVHWGEEPAPAIPPAVGIPVDQLLRRSTHHGHDLRPDLPQSVRPLPERPHRERRKWFVLGALSRERHGQDGRHGPRRSMARRTHSTEKPSV